MGTSTSSRGPGPNVSLDPPWIDDVLDGLGSGTVPVGDGEPVPPTGASGAAQPARYSEARRELKKNTQGRDLVSQMQLPGVPETLTAQLPPAISIPLDAEVEDEDGEGVIYKPLAQATLADVNAHLQLLATQINADTRRHRALKELRDLALAAGATDHSPLLSAFSVTESLMTEVA